MASADITEQNYIESLEYAGQCGGEYLESINQTDLAMLTAEEWHTFLDVIVKNQRRKMAELPPF